MNLTKPPYPDLLHTAAYFLIQAGHRKTAIDTAIGVLRQQAHAEAPGDEAEPWSLPSAIIADWVVEALVQGAWLREYHQWEVATKTYIRGQYSRAGVADLPSGAWRGGKSHVAKVAEHLLAFNAVLPRHPLDAIDAIRAQVNAAKHDSERFVDREDYDALVNAIAAFWQALDLQEAFTRPRR